MNMTLARVSHSEYGIFSFLRPEVGQVLATVEHAYQDPVTGMWMPKIPNGLYVCKRGMHQLLHGGPFETFEITGVPGHDHLLFHKGNTEDASHGCVCLGMSHEGKAVLESEKAFHWFMGFQQGLSTFMLTVQ